MALGKDYAGQHCGLARALEVIGERWTMLVIRDAFYGVRRFNDFAVQLDAPKAVLTDRLRRLCDAGVLEKRLYRESPPRYEYVLTPRGERLWPALHSLVQWGQEFSEEPVTRVFTHTACGGRLDGNAFCPECGLTPPAGDVATRPGPGPQRDDPVSRALAAPHRLLEPLVVE
ncbi:winged helix-turn-helix transcriptional regulator [Salininema proteolyticum]|uniref:Winged helix-turn-helix transcriptional regulator n=1 Tax=Salininema proteolyticum TaxID=1607685 RepID=A0ABV8U0P3_9ACTN